MAESKTMQATDEEARETEQIEEGQEVEEKPLLESQCSGPSIAVPDSSSIESECRQERSQSETLGLPPSLPSSENNHDSDCRSFSQLLAGAMASPGANSTAALSDGLDVKPMISGVAVDPTRFSVVSPLQSFDPAGFKGQFEMSHQEVLATVTAQAAQAQTPKQLQSEYPSPSSEISPVSLTQSMSSGPTPTSQLPELPPGPQDNNVCTPEVDQQNSPDQKAKPAYVMKTPSSDGYNWRKYGQKQVKSTESSRSYYKCTYSDCHAKKKVERCDHSGRVNEIIYKGRHNHDPPRKIKCTKARRLVSSAGPVGGSETIDRPVRKLSNSDPSTSRRDLRQLTLPTPEQKRRSPSTPDVAAVPRAGGEHGDEPEPKRRIKDGSASYSVPLFKTVKEPKVVVQAAGDVGISGDGYRWRKYGQKMVKGNPYPRSYYRCTSAGCPVRKHVERATDDTTAVIITYEGKHDHDMPVPKKRHGPPSAALLIAAAAAMNNAQLKKSESLPNRRASTQWSMDMEGDLTGEKALELGGEKALESARTLLSIGIELKPC